MDEMKNGKGVSDGKTCPCGCGSCGCTGMGMRRYGGGYGLLRIVIGLLVLALAFWIGVKAGEFRSEFMSGRFGGYGREYPMMMRSGYGGGMGGYGGTGVMPGTAGGSTGTSTVQ